MLNLSFKCADALGAQGHHYPKICARLAGSLALPPDFEGNYLPAMLPPANDCQEGAEEAEDRSSLSRALQETQRRHGEQDYATPA